MNEFFDDVPNLNQDPLCLPREAENQQIHNREGGGLQPRSKCNYLGGESQLKIGQADHAVPGRLLLGSYQQSSG